MWGARNQHQNTEMENAFSTMLKLLVLERSRVKTMREGTHSGGSSKLSWSEIKRGSDWKKVID